MKDYFICSSCGEGRDISQAAPGKKGGKGFRRECNMCVNGSFFAGAHSTYDPMIKISKAEAIELGHSVYWTGKACINGHIAHRNVKSGTCLVCARSASSRYKAKKATGSDDPIKARKAVDDILEIRRLARELDYLR
jgi:hypothetical protein